MKGRKKRENPVGRCCESEKGAAERGDDCELDGTLELADVFVFVIGRL